MTLEEIVTRLKSLQKWHPETGDSGPFAGEIDWDEDDDGEWVRAEDVEQLIKNIEP